GMSAAKVDQLEEEMAKLQHSYEESASSMRRLQEEEKALRESLRVTTEELENSRQSITVSETEKMSLRQQLAELQDQLEHAKRAAPINGEVSNGVASQASGLINLVSSSSKKPKRRSAGFEPTNTDRFSGTFNPRPVSMAFGATSGHQQTLSGSTFKPDLENVEMELENLLA
ncbi:myosin-2, partial [Aureobasidium melanogenum]